MSVGSIQGSSTQWQWQSQAARSPSSSGSGTTDVAGNIANSGTTAAGGSLSAFMQAFSADLQSMLSQLGGGTTSGATSTSSTVPSDGTSGGADASQAAGGAHHHHHHHHHASGAGGDAQGTANQLVGSVASSLQNGSLSTGQINQSASVLATDVMQALQSYGAPAAASAGTSILA